VPFIISGVFSSIQPAQVCDVMVVQVCDDCLILRSVTGAICERWCPFIISGVFSSIQRAQVCNVIVILVCDVITVCRTGM